ncbi:MAG: LmeA family phospholipid-binding protein, partial [Pseudoclavibacter sp.]|nr:LmeA family phospholipid-binding protein [Pseudoclavibacter sp.]
SQPGGGFAQTGQPGGGFGQGGASAPYGPAQSAPLGGPAGVGKKRRGPLIAVLVSAGLVVLLVLGGVIAELVTRSGVEGELREQADAIVGETEAEGSTVAGGFLVEVHASSYLMQKLSGRFEHITMRGEGMTINGKNYDVVYDIYDLPADLKGPAGRIEVSLHVADDQFLGLVNEQASDDGSGGDSLPQDKMEIALGDGKYTVSYDAGEGYGFEGEASLAVESGKFVIKPGKQTLLLPSGNIDITTEGESNQLPTCEQESPADVEALEVDISPDGLSAKWQATGPEATLDNLGSFGLCIFE